MKVKIDNIKKILYKILSSYISNINNNIDSALINCDDPQPIFSLSHIRADDPHRIFC